MNIVVRAEAFVQSLWELARRTWIGWRVCSYCGSTDTNRWGYYARRPWFFSGRKEVVVPRHRCKACQRTYSEESPLLVYKSRYAREVHRAAVDAWEHDRTSMRRTAERLRSWLGRQERWLMWRPLDPEPALGARCELSASTVCRWVDRAGEEAERSVPGQMEGIACSGEMGTDGIWVRLRGGVKRVGLLLIDYVSGLAWPAVVVPDEESESSWAQLFERAQRAGLLLDKLNGLTSDGAQGLLSYLRRVLTWVHQQRCAWHLWQNLARRIAQQVKAAAGAWGAEDSSQRREQLRGELEGLVHAILDAPTYEQAEQALASLAAHAWGEPLAKMLHPLLDAILIYRMACHQGLQRVSPEWYWRDFRQRLSRGRNHGSQQRQERALLAWAVYRNFTPAQRRHEQKRHYRYPGQSPLEVAGANPGRLSYLDALHV